MSDEFLEKGKTEEGISESIIEVPRIDTEIKSRPRLQDLKRERQILKLEILKKLSSGTGLREGLNHIVAGNMGALIVVSNENVNNIFKGGFKVNCKFTSKRLAELAKMDGAIILSEDFKKILVVNALLVPDRSFSTNETGTRHQAAERTAKQTGGVVIAISERRGTISVYYGNFKYVLQNTEDLLRKTTETLQILEKQREVFDELLTNLNVLEMTNLVSTNEVCTILQRLEMISKMSEIINEYIVELGREGLIVRMRMRELTKGIEKNQELILEDYFTKPGKIMQFFKNISFDELLDSEEILQILFASSENKRVVAKGYRILEKSSLSDNEINALIAKFKSLNEILEANEASLKKVLREKSESFKKEFDNLREQIMIGG